MVELERARGMLEMLGLSQSADALDAHLEYATREQPTYIKFLNRLLDSESESRKKRSEETRLKLSSSHKRRRLPSLISASSLALMSV